MVGPTNRNPRARRSRLIASDSSVWDGISSTDRHRFRMGFPPTNDHRYASSDPSSRCTARVALAFAIAASTFARFRTIPGFARSRSTFRESNRATLAGSNPANAFRYPSRLRRMVAHDSPAWAPSSTSISNRWRSSSDGTPHSSSWYARYRGSSRPAHSHRFTMAADHTAGVRHEPATAGAARRLLGIMPRIMPRILPRILPMHLADVDFPAGHPHAGESGPIFGFAVVHAAGVLLFDTAGHQSLVVRTESGLSSWPARPCTPPRSGRARTIPAAPDCPAPTIPTRTLSSSAGSATSIPFAPLRPRRGGLEPAGLIRHPPRRVPPCRDPRE